MNNIINLNRTGLPVTTAPSPIMFEAYERHLYYEGARGDRFDNTDHKALVRVINREPVCLNVVKNTYKMVQNGELFTAVEAGLRNVSDTYEVKDSISYHGKLCYRQYVFKNVNIDSPEHDKIAFRVIVQNGFGGSAIKLHAGAIDFFCTNGMILGDFTSVYAKHTSGVKLDSFTRVVEHAVDVFWKNKDMWFILKSTVLKSEKLVHEWINKQFGERLGGRMFHHYLTVERPVRGGGNMWALYSTMTYYSSHSTGEFGLRETKNDHTAATMLGREQAVRKVLQSGDWKELRTAA